MDLQFYNMRIAVNAAMRKMSANQTRRYRTLVGEKIWASMNDGQKQEAGRIFYQSGDYARLGLSVARRCARGAPQTYRLAMPQPNSDVASG
jgi:hypothetical protein